MSTTIPALKRAFLAGQVRILNAPLDPPEEWRDAGPRPKEGDLSNGIVDEALNKGKLIF
jgi:hypothetical protein